MASKVYNSEEIELSDDSTVVLKPLSIKRLRVFMPKMQEWQDFIADEEAQEKDPMGLGSMSLLVEAAVICLLDQRDDWKDNPELAEDVLDMETVYRVLEVCGGIKLNDPNLLKLAQEAALKA